MIRAVRHLGVPLRLFTSWLLAGAALALVARDPGFAAAMMLASSPLLVAAIAVGAVCARRIERHPLVWTGGALAGVTVLAALLTGPLVLLSLFISCPLAVLFGAGFLSVPARGAMREAT